MPQLSSIAALCVLVLASGPSDARAQSASGSGAKPGAWFVHGGVLVTSILHDTQDAGSGYLHYNFIGALDWPATGAQFGGGVFVARRWSVGAEIALRRPKSATISEEQHGHVDTWRLSSLYTSRERLLSFVVRFHALPGSRVNVQPLGGVTRSWVSQSLTGRSGVYVYPPFPPFPISKPDVTLDSAKYGLVGGADVAFVAGRGVAIVCSPRIHWIHRDQPGEYDHVAPNAGRVITEVAGGVQWRPRRR